MMRRLASIVAVFLLLGTAAPVLACVSGSAMSQQESACCRTMHGQCGTMAKTGCCRMEVRQDLQQLATPMASLPVSWHVVSLFVSAVHPPSSFLMVRWSAEHSPPGLVAAESTVLRI